MKMQTQRTDLMDQGRGEEGGGEMNGEGAWKHIYTTIQKTDASGNFLCD